MSSSDPSVGIEEYAIPVAKGISIIEKWYELNPDLDKFKMYLRRELVKRLNSAKLEEELRTMSPEELYTIVKEISWQFLHRKR